MLSPPRRNVLDSCSRSHRSSGIGAFLTFSPAVLWSALLVALLVSYTTPVSAFLLSPPTPSSSSSSSSSASSCSSRSAAKHAERVAPLYGIKRKVKVEMEENFSGKVVEPAGAETSMFGSDANALFDVIEKNKKKAADAAAAANAALAADDGDGDEDTGGDGDREGADGGEA